MMTGVGLGLGVPNANMGVGQEAPRINVYEELHPLVMQLSDPDKVGA